MKNYSFYDLISKSKVQLLDCTAHTTRAHHTVRPKGPNRDIF
jgi:hypothetical protein